MTLPPARNKTGPVPTEGQGRYNVILDSALAEWGKRQPGGLSDLLRRLLAQARAQEQESSPLTSYVLENGPLNELGAHKTYSFGGLDRDSDFE